MRFCFGILLGLVLGVSSKRKVVLLIGIEGTGHHLIETVLKQSQLYVHAFTPDVVMAREHFSQKYLQWYDAKSEPYIIHGADSFPEGRPLHAINHPHLPGFLLLNETGEINLRLVVLKRDPVDAVCSALRRFHADPISSGRTASDSLYMIQSIVQSVPHTTVCFKRAMNDSAYLFQALWPALNGIADKQMLRNATSHVVLFAVQTHHTYSETTCPKYAFLKNILHSQRTSC